MSLLWHNKTRCTCEENNTFIQNGGKTLSRDDNNNISHVTNTEKIVKLAQMIHRYIIKNILISLTENGPRYPQSRINIILILLAISL